MLELEEDQSRRQLLGSNRRASRMFISNRKISPLSTSGVCLYTERGGEQQREKERELTDREEEEEKKEKEIQRTERGIED